MNDGTYEPKCFAGLARLMAEGLPPTFRIFAELNLRNLMEMQAELLGLERKLELNDRFKQSVQSSTLPNKELGPDVVVRLQEVEKEILSEARIKLREYSKKDNDAMSKDVP
jgi:hypothetical protein